jgi:hypothetical protein
LLNINIFDEPEQWWHVLSHMSLRPRPKPCRKYQIGFQSDTLRQSH